MGGIFVPPVQGQPPSWRDSYQFFGALTGKSKWGRLISITSYDDDDHYAVTIQNQGTGGHLNIPGLLQVQDTGVTIGALTLSGALVGTSAVFSSTVTATRFISTIATGTAPFTVASATQVAFLNAQFVGGKAPGTAVADLAFYDANNRVVDSQLLDGVNSTSYARLDAASNFTTAPTINGATIWTSANDGAGSGLDADALDGLTLGTTAGTIAFYDVSGRVANSQLLDGIDSSGYAQLGAASNFTTAPTISGNTVWHAGNDGAGSGLDADTLDGISSTGFLVLSTGGTVSGAVVLSSTLQVVSGLTIGGAIDHDGTSIGFFSSTPSGKETVTGSRGGNAALASLCSALANYGLITNSTS